MLMILLLVEIIHQLEHYKMDVILEISLILMGMIVGYLISTWPRINLGNRKRKRDKDYGLNNSDNLDWQDKLRTSESYESESWETTINTRNWDINFHSTSTQGPPRRSAMATLEDLLEIALKNENYEYAAKLRDRINKQKNNEDNNSC